jgi:pilus assembly protein TadC
MGVTCQNQGFRSFNATFDLKMLSEQEQNFVKWWQQNRLKEKKLLKQLTIGLPLGVAFGLPIILSVLFRGWYKRMPYVSGTQLTVILVAVLSIVVFYAVFRMRFKWELNEQRYNELCNKQEKEAGKQQS